jgi:Bifunctional DNA primase/polymerase, N-terminal
MMPATATDNPTATPPALSTPALSLAEAARAYAEMGWSVFRLAPRSKSPLKGSHGFKDPTTDPATIRAWWTEHPDANIGIATGQVSNLTIVDIDPRHSGHLTLDALIAEHGDLPATAAVATGSGGVHYYFRHVFTAVKGNNALGPGIDIKSNGGFILAPPSIHPNGNAYRWATVDQEPGDLPFWVVTMERPKNSAGNVRGMDQTRSSTSSCPVSIEHRFRGEKSDAACAQALGLPLDRKFSCVLHRPDEHPSAWLFVGKGGDLLYHCEHEGGWTLTLPQVRASLAYGKVTQIRDENGKAQSIEHLAWRLRLLHEAGALQPLEVPHRSLGGKIKSAVKAVYEGLLLLLGLKWHIWPGNGTTFSWRFAAAWCGVTKWAAEDAMKWLMEQGYVHSVGTSRSAYGKVAHVLMPSLVAQAKQTPKEWAIYRQEQREQEALMEAEQVLADLAADSEEAAFEAERWRFEEGEDTDIDYIDHIDDDDFDGVDIGDIDEGGEETQDVDSEAFVRES